MSSSPDKGDEGRLLIGKVHDAVEEHYFGPLSVGEALEKIRGLVAFTPSTTPHNVTLEKWLSYQPHLEDHGTLPITHEWMYTADIVRAAWEAGTTSRSATPCIEDGPFKGLPKPVKVPEGYVMVDEKSFGIILDVLTEEQTREICMKEGERLYLNRADGGKQTDG